MSRGIFIVFDGIDGAGKTTQLGLLANGLRRCGETVVTSKEPTNGTWGRKLRESAASGRMSLEDELAAFVEDRREHVANIIRPALEAGAIVLVDRYLYSTIAYQGARGADPKAIEAAMQFAPRPDLVLLLDADPVVTVSRIHLGRGETPNEFEGVEYLRQVRSIFLDLASRDPTIAVVDAAQSIDRVLCDVCSLVIDGPLKAHRCAKPYGCDGLYCAYRQTDSCSWAKVAAELQNR